MAQRCFHSHRELPQKQRWPLKYWTFHLMCVSARKLIDACSDRSWILRKMVQRRFSCYRQPPQKWTSPLEYQISSIVRVSTLKLFDAWCDRFSIFRKNGATKFPLSSGATAEVNLAIGISNIICHKCIST